ncbi:MAG: zinc metalloprotease HtpX [Deltaproteobacteria bacterium]|nr:zinc metalloprotease HtpX [Deltaproteobacteria bacterium]
MTSQLKTFILLSFLSGLVLLLGGVAGGEQGLVIAFVFALLMNLGSYWFSDKIVLRMYSAKELSPSDAPMLHKIVDELARNAGIPKPRICVMPEEAPNAFATGRSPDHAVVAVTDGLLRLLDTEELRGVLAHEIGHIANRDILIQSVACVLASVIMMLAGMARYAAIFGGGRDREGGGNPLFMILMAVLAPVAATLIQMAISRSREYLADASGAAYSRNPRALASALGKLQSYSHKLRLRRESPGTAHMFIVNPLSGSSLAKLFSTHPPIEERIDRLLRMK